MPDPAWQKFYRRFDAYAPWNVGNWTKDTNGDAHASMSWWAKDKEEFERSGGLWMPVVYPGFSWDNLQRKPAGTTLIPRRGGRFLWEQFHELSKLAVDCIYVAMFDEVDEGTAIVTDPLELMPFVARPRSKAVGAQSGVGQVVNGAEVNIKNSFGFGHESYDHSGEFNRTIQDAAIWRFYDRLISSLFPEQ